MTEQTSVTIFNAADTMTQLEPNLDPILRRLETGSDQKKAAEAALKDKGAAVVELYRDLKTKYEPSVLASRIEFQAARTAFKDCQYPYAQLEIEDMKDVMEEGCRGFAYLLGANEKSAELNWAELQKTLITNLTSDDTKTFRFDLLINNLLPMLSPLNYKIFTQDVPDDLSPEDLSNLAKASELYARVKRLAEITGQGTVVDHVYLMGKSAHDVVQEGLREESNLGGVNTAKDGDKVKYIEKIGFVPNYFQNEDFDYPIAVTEPYIAPDIYF